MLRFVLVPTTISHIISNDVINTGAAYGTAKSGVGIAAMGVLRPDLIVKSTAHLPIPGHHINFPRHYSRHYGWYHRYLWSCRVCLDLK